MQSQAGNGRRRMDGSNANPPMIRCEGNAMIFNADSCGVNIDVMAILEITR